MVYRYPSHSPICEGYFLPSEQGKKVEAISALTKKVSMPAVVVKTVGKKTYIVENIFSEDAKMDLPDKIRRLIDNDLKKPRSALQPATSEVTYQQS